MKTAGDILSTLFDERFLQKAHGYSKFFDSWKDITEKNGIAAAADHSRIKDLEKGIVLVEMDHPGWKQILQTKQSKLLNDFRIRFPQLDISGISLILKNSEKIYNDKSSSAENTQTRQTRAVNETQNEQAAFYPADESEIKTRLNDINSIKDEGFKESLIKLGKTIAENEKL